MTVSHPTRARSRATARTAVSAAAPLLLLTALPAPAHAAATTHTVQAGDTLGAIALTYDVPLAELLRLNGLDRDSLIHPGQVLLLTEDAVTAEDAAIAPAPVSEPAPAATPDAPAATVTVRRGEGWWHLERRTGVPMAELQRLNDATASTMLHPGMVLATTTAATTGAPTADQTPAPVPPTTTATGQEIRYTVVPGDTLSGISQRFEVSIDRLRTLNGLTRSSVLRAGQVLLVSDGTLEVDPVSVVGPIGSTFLTYTYPPHVTASANENLRRLQETPQPTPAQMQQIVRETAVDLGVDPALALGHAYTESRFQHVSVSPANAIGAMQVIPAAGEFASDLVGRELNLLDPYDNATAGIALIRYMHAHTPTEQMGIGAYYQGLGGVLREGLRPDTQQYVARVSAARAMF